MSDKNDIMGEAYEAGRDVANTDQMVSEMERELQDAPPDQYPLKIPYVHDHLWQVFWQKMRENKWISQYCCVVLFDAGGKGGRGIGVGLMKDKDLWLSERARAHFRSSNVKVLSIDEYASAVTAVEYVEMIRGDARKAAEEKITNRKN